MSKSDDLIRRSDAMGAVQDHFNADGFKGYNDGQQMMDRINSLPSAEAVQGKWIMKHDGVIFKRTWGVCSRCGNTLDFDGLNAGRGDANFCPNCGAKMGGGAE